MPEYPTLQRGDHSEWVEYLQKLLHGENFYIDGDVDGKFGPKTEYAVWNYQAYHHLTLHNDSYPDGSVVGPETWERLTARDNEPAPEPLIPQIHTEEIRRCWIEHDKCPRFDWKHVKYPLTYGTAPLCDIPDQRWNWQHSTEPAHQGQHHCMICNGYF